MAYALVLYLHSWLRWLVVIAFGWALARAVRAVRSGRPREAADARARTLLLAALHTQLLLGLLLYFVLSPLRPTSLEGLRAAMKISALRFFAVEHPFGMTVAAVVAQIAVVRSKRTNDDRVAHRRLAFGLALAAVVVLASIPWPGFPYARPLFRVP